MTTKSLFIPTPGIEQCRNYVIIQRLVQERIRSVMMGDSFVDKSHFLASQFLEVPVQYQTQEDIGKYLKSEAKELLAAFKKYEETPAYKEAIGLLKEQEGASFNITNTTLSGMVVVLETE
jgi:hypothetical protein